MPEVWAEFGIKEAWSEFWASRRNKHNQDLFHCSMFNVHLSVLKKKNYSTLLSWSWILFWKLGSAPALKSALMWSKATHNYVKSNLVRLTSISIHCPFQQSVEERMAGMMKNILLCFSFLDLQELVSTFHDLVSSEVRLSHV